MTRSKTKEHMTGSEETMEGEIGQISQQEAPHSGGQSRTGLSMIPESPRS